MRLLLNYKGINKIMPKVEDYAGIVQFVHENFFLRMSKWTLSYIDSDGDAISLDSDLDVQTMLDTTRKDHLKVYIKDADQEAEKSQNMGQQFDISLQGTESVFINEEPKNEIEPEAEPVVPENESKV